MEVIFCELPKFVLDFKFRQPRINGLQHFSCSYLSISVVFDNTFTVSNANPPYGFDKIEIRNVIPPKTSRMPLYSIQATCYYAPLIRPKRASASASFLIS